MPNETIIAKETENKTKQNKKSDAPATVLTMLLAQA